MKRTKLIVSLTLILIIAITLIYKKRSNVFYNKCLCGLLCDDYIKINKNDTFDYNSLVDIHKLNKVKYCRDTERLINIRIVNSLGDDKISIYNTLIINNIKYSPIVIIDSSLTLVEKYRIAHILKNCMFLDIDDIFNDKKEIHFYTTNILSKVKGVENKDIAVYLFPNWLYDINKCTFNMICFSDDSTFIYNHKELILVYLKELYNYVLDTSNKEMQSTYMEDNLLNTINKIGGKRYIDPT